MRDRTRWIALRDFDIVTPPPFLYFSLEEDGDLEAVVIFSPRE